VRGRYIESWTSYIQVLRNHPSIFDWPMCNEYYMGPTLAPRFYDIAKQLDPSRLAMDSDGSCSARSGAPTRKTLDFCSEQFDIGLSLALSRSLSLALSLSLSRTHTHTHCVSTLLQGTSAHGEASR
jgi:hypothetical protein